MAPSDLSDAEILDLMRLYLKRTQQVVRSEIPEGHYLRSFFEGNEPRALAEAIAELRSRHV